MIPDSTGSTSKPASQKQGSIPTSRSAPVVKTVTLVSPTHFIGGSNGPVSLIDADRHHVMFSLDPWGVTADFGEKRWVIPFSNVKAMELA